MTELVAAFATREWDRDIDTAALCRVTATHLRQWVNGDPEAATVAALAGLRELTRLSAEFDLARRSAGVRVTGQINARVGQTCVVTLEPVEAIWNNGRFYYAPGWRNLAKAVPYPICAQTKEPPDLSQ
jgi:hypothetical protein